MEVLQSSSNDESIQKAIAGALIITYIIYGAMYVLQLFHPITTVNIGIPICM